MICYVHTVEYYVAGRCNKLNLHIAMWNEVLIPFFLSQVIEYFKSNYHLKAGRQNQRKNGGSLDYVFLLSL